MNKTIIGAVAAVVIIVGAVFLTNNNASAPTTDNNNQQQVGNTQTPNPQPSTEPTPAPTPSSTQPATHTISMGDNGFTPNTLTVKKGDTVTFVNNGTKAIWPASAPHPTHTDYPAFDPKKAVAVGESWSFVFDQVGTWKYHDHLNPSRFGSITVQ